MTILENILREIKYYQRQDALFPPRAPFARVVKEVMTKIAMQDLRLQSSALAALQWSAEEFLNTWFKMLYVFYDLDLTVEILPRDMLK